MLVVVDHPSFARAIDFIEGKKRSAGVRANTPTISSFDDFWIPACKSRWAGTLTTFWIPDEGLGASVCGRTAAAKTSVGVLDVRSPAIDRDALAPAGFRVPASVSRAFLRPAAALASIWVLDERPAATDRDALALTSHWVPDLVFRTLLRPAGAVASIGILEERPPAINRDALAPACLRVPALFVRALLRLAGALAGLRVLEVRPHAINRDALTPACLRVPAPISHTLLRSAATLAFFPVPECRRRAVFLSCADAFARLSIPDEVLGARPARWADALAHLRAPLVGPFTGALLTIANAPVGVPGIRSAALQLPLALTQAGPEVQDLVVGALRPWDAGSKSQTGRPAVHDDVVFVIVELRTSRSDQC